jgi:hypothetical protein
MVDRGDFRTPSHSPRRVSISSIASHGPSDRLAQAFHREFDVGRLQEPPALDLGLISIVGVAPKVFPNEFSGGRALPGELLANEGISGHALLKRGLPEQAIISDDNRRVSNGDQGSRIAALALKRGKSVDFTGYWQRHVPVAN